MYMHVMALVGSCNNNEIIKLLGQLENFRKKPKPKEIFNNWDA